MAKLTKKERAWVDEVNEVLARCPSPKKIGFYTIGDPVVSLYDLRHEAECLDGDLVRIANANGWLFDEELNFPSSVNGVCG
ncbi:hypothetical protein E1B77_20695 [Salmonella enterica subsp. enterica]|nr:hypothetical protein [Salmonella enterica subsp. enterica]